MGSNFSSSSNQIISFDPFSPREQDPPDAPCTRFLALSKGGGDLSFTSLRLGRISMFTPIIPSPFSPSRKSASTPFPNVRSHLFLGRFNREIEPSWSLVADYADHFFPVCPAVVFLLQRGGLFFLECPSSILANGSPPPRHRGGPRLLFWPRSVWIPCGVSPFFSWMKASFFSPGFFMLPSRLADSLPCVACLVCFR